MSTIEKPSYEEIERRFQSYCKHDGGTLHAGNGCYCSICMWPEGKCQHRKSDGFDKFCRECGEPLKQEAAK